MQPSDFLGTWAADGTPSICNRSSGRSPFGRDFSFDLFRAYRTKYWRIPVLIHPFRYILNALVSTCALSLTRAVENILDYSNQRPELVVCPPHYVTMF